MEFERKGGRQDRTVIDTDSSATAHIKWALKALEEGEKITVPGFVKAFGYSSEQNANEAYLKLISSSNFTQPLRSRLDKNYKTWLDNHALTFWAERSVALKAKLALTATAADMVDGGRPIAHCVLQEESDAFVQSRESLSLAGQKHLHDTFDGEGSQNKCTKSSKRSTTANETISKHNLSSRSEATYPSRPRCIGSPSPLPSSLFPPIGSSKLPPPVNSTEGLQYAVVNQRTEWSSDGVDIGLLFKAYKQHCTASLDLAIDDIIDLTADSHFIAIISDTEFSAVLSDFPKFESDSEELVELTLALGGVCSYEQFRDRVFNDAPNTPIRRFLFRIVDCYSRYFPKHMDIPHLLERQAMFDLLCPFIRGALLVYDVESDVSEIAIIGSGQRKNFGKDASDKQSKCRRADITGNDGMGNQVLLAECSKIYEKDIRKFKEDRRKLARAMKDSWDLTVRKFAEDQSRPPENLSVFGLQVFDEKLFFLKLDYRGHYRLWQIETAQLPMRHHNFFEKTAICSKIALKFAAAVAKEIGQRKKLSVISSAEALMLSRASRRLKRTTDS
ncbi:hypothetical protein EMPS_11581 [Entomortierella parvispora]|uniref:Uncharacterized protein n=1 Tax=Entomortierella parvispora TaxID=205924 RepID=A0A9P3HMK1_9FUNG|nr:hypothetical protein EMPS_11581 [Entomortierella parvispora]